MGKSTKVSLILGILFFISADFVQSNCSISKDWIELSMEERLLMSSIVVYGKTKEHRANVKKIAGKSYYEIDAVFEVYCVLEPGEDPVTEEIIIERIAPRDGCSGTKDNMGIGEEAIVGLKAGFDGRFEYDEAMPTQSASFAATKGNLFTVSSICNLQSWSSPVDATVNKCPICGTGNFTGSVMSGSETTRPCFFDGVQFVNDTDCSMFVSSSFDADSTCIPEDYMRTCTRIVYQEPGVTCECTAGKQRGQMDMGGLGEIDSALAILPCFLTITVCLFSVFLSS